MTDYVLAGLPKRDAELTGEADTLVGHRSNCHEEIRGLVFPSLG